MTTPELHVRPLTVDDAPAWVELDARLVEAEQRSEAWSAEELAEELAVPWAHLATRSRVYERPDGRLAGLAWVSARPGAWRAVLDLEVDPVEADWLGDELRAWAVDTARAVREEGGTPDATVLELSTQANQAAREALARRHGFVPVRHFHELIRDLAVPIEDRPVPEGVTVQPWDPDRSEDVRETAIAAFRDHWGSFPHTAETWAAATTGATTRPDLHRVAVAHALGHGPFGIELLPLLVLGLLAMALPLNIGGWGPREGVMAVAFGAARLPGRPADRAGHQPHLFAIPEEVHCPGHRAQRTRHIGHAGAAGDHRRIQS